MRAAVWPPADRGRCQVARWPGGQVVLLLVHLFVFPGGEEGARQGGIYTFT